MKKRVTWAEPAPAAHAPSRHWLVHILINVQLIVLLEIGILLLTGQGQRFIEWLRPGTVGTGNSGISAGTGETTAAPAAAALGAAGDPYPVTQAAVLGGLLALAALAGLVPRLVGWRRARRRGLHPGRRRAALRRARGHPRRLARGPGPGQGSRRARETAPGGTRRAREGRRRPREGHSRRSTRGDG
jgi:hypothetical protein